MGKHKVGDEVLVKATVDNLYDEEDGVELSFREGGEYYGYGYFEPSEIVCLASEFEQRGWVDVKDRLPEEEGVYQATLKDKSVVVVYWRDNMFITRHLSHTVIAWKPLSAPYTPPPVPEWDCNVCVHMDVCMYRGRSDIGGGNEDCGGEHYYEGE